MADIGTLSPPRPINNSLATVDISWEGKAIARITNVNRAKLIKYSSLAATELRNSSSGIVAVSLPADIDHGPREKVPTGVGYKPLFAKDALEPQYLFKYALSFITKQNFDPATYGGPEVDVPIDDQSNFDDVLTLYIAFLSLDLVAPLRQTALRNNLLRRVTLGSFVITATHLRTILDYFNPEIFDDPELIRAALTTVLRNMKTWPRLTNRTFKGWKYTKWNEPWLAGQLDGFAKMIGKSDTLRQLVDEIEEKK